MSCRMRRNSALLRYLQKAKPTQRKALLKVISDDELKTICECILNILQGTVKITPKVKRELQKHKTCLRKLGDKKVSVGQNVKCLFRKGVDSWVR